MHFKGLIISDYSCSLIKIISSMRWIRFFFQSCNDFCAILDGLLRSPESLIKVISCALWASICDYVHPRVAPYPHIVPLHVCSISTHFTKRGKRKRVGNVASRTRTRENRMKNRGQQLMFFLPTFHTTFFFAFARNKMKYKIWCKMMWLQLKIYKKIIKEPKRMEFENGGRPRHMALCW